MKRLFLLCVLLCGSAFATPANYYVDCNNGSTGNPGSFDKPWRTPLNVASHAASTGFNPGDAIYFKRDCVFHDGIKFSWVSSGITNSGTSSLPILIDSYGGQTLTPGTGAPPEFTGKLPIAGAYWSVYSGNIWVSKPLFDASGSSDNCPTDKNCVPCPAAGIIYSCYDQALNVLNYVRFGTIWGNDQEVGVAGNYANLATYLTQDRDWFFDPSIVSTHKQSLFVYCTCTGGVTPDVYFGQVAPVAISGEDTPANGAPIMLNLVGVQWLQVQHLLFDWYDGLGIFIQSNATSPAADHIWLANLAANSYVENGQYRYNTGGALCVSPSACSTLGTVEQYNQIGLWINEYTAANSGQMTPFTDIHAWNLDLQMNNSGVQVGAPIDYACSTCALDLVNDRIYASRTYGVSDYVGGAGQLSYSHLYANNLATALETDVQTIFALPAAGISCSGNVVTATFAAGYIPAFPLLPGQLMTVQTSSVAGLSGLPAAWAGNFTVASWASPALTWNVASCPGASATGGSINMIYLNDKGQNLPYVSDANLNSVTSAIDYSHVNFPGVTQWQRWKPYVMLNYDDPGLVQYSDNYVAQVLPLATSKLGNAQFSVPTVTGGSYSGLGVNGLNINPGFVSEIQTWINAGYDILTHSTSHSYWKPPAEACGPGAVYKVPCHIFNLLHYTGSVSSTVTLTITHTAPNHALLAVASSPADPALAGLASLDLSYFYPWQSGAPGSMTTLSQLRLLLSNTGVLGVTQPGGEPSCGTGVCVDAYANLGALSHSLDDTYASLGVKGAISLVGAGVNVDFLNFNDTAVEPPYFETDEMTWAQNWMNNYLTGLPAHRLYVMPGTYGDSASETVAAGLGYAAVRGTGSLKPCCAANTTLGNGYDKFNILSQGVNSNLQNLSYLQMRALMQADVFKNALWGRPVAFFWHIDELPYDQAQNMMDAVNQALPLGDNVLGDTAFVNAVLLNAPAAGHVPLPGQCVANDMVPPIGVGDSGTTYVANSFYACASTGAEANWEPTVNSPTNRAGVALGSPWNYDLNGAARFTWDIGAYLGNFWEVSLSWTNCVDWTATTAYTAQELCPSVGNAGGYSFAPSAAGTSGSVEPVWPQSVGATVGPDGTIGTWTNQGVCTSNNVYRGTVSGGPYTGIYKSTHPITAYTDASMGQGGVYYYVVTSVCGGVESGFSSESQARVP